MFSLYPSLISADLMRLGIVIKQLDPHVQGYHIDIMDGHFVPNLTWGPQFVVALQNETQLPLHIHCMVSDPEKWLEWLILRPIDLLIIHKESVLDPLAFFEKAREKDLQIGLAINPETSVASIQEYLILIDHLLIMSVHPGFSGQRFIESTFQKITQAKKMIDEVGAHASLGVDGGVGVHNIRSLVLHGVTEVAAAQAIFSEKNPVIGVQKLINAVLQ